MPDRDIRSHHENPLATSLVGLVINASMADGTGDVNVLPTLISANVSISDDINFLNDGDSVPTRTATFSFVTAAIEEALEGGITTESDVSWTGNHLFNTPVFAVANQVADDSDDSLLMTLGETDERYPRRNYYSRDINEPAGAIEVEVGPDDLRLDMGPTGTDGYIYEIFVTISRQGNNRGRTYKFLMSSRGLDDDGAGTLTFGRFMRVAQLEEVIAWSVANNFVSFESTITDVQRFSPNGGDRYNLRFLIDNQNANDLNISFNARKLAGI